MIIMVKATAVSNCDRYSFIGVSLIYDWVMAALNSSHRFEAQPRNCSDVRNWVVRAVPPCLEMDKILTFPSLQSTTTVTLSSQSDSSSLSGSTSSQNLPSVGRSVSLPVKTTAVHAIGIFVMLRG